MTWLLWISDTFPTEEGNRRFDSRMFSKNKNYHIPSTVLDSKGTTIKYPQAAYNLKIKMEYHLSKKLSKGNNSE